MQARENLAKLAETETDNPEIIQKLAELDEKLEKLNVLKAAHEQLFKKNLISAIINHQQAKKKT